MATIRQITLKSGKITYEIQVKAKEKGSGKQIKEKNKRKEIKSWKFLSLPQSLAKS